MAEISNAERPSGNGKIAVAWREAEALRRLLAGEDLVAIGRALDYSGTDDNVRATAYGLIRRALRKQLAGDAELIRDREDGRIDAMVAALWPVATGDLDLVRALIDRKAMKPLLDEDGREIVYVVPAMAQLQAIDQVMRLGKRQADIHGTDFQHGLDKRKADLEDQYVVMLRGIVEAILRAIDPTPEQESRAKLAVAEQLALARGNTE